MKTNIIITGVCGFVGFNLARQLLKNKKVFILGIDNINNYYSVKLKMDRLKYLLKFKNFKFSKISIVNKKKLNSIFIKFKPKYIYHFAAQAGVQHSIKHPQKYIDNNVIGFFNILEISREIKPHKIFFASSSSCMEIKFQIAEKLILNPKNMYG